MSILAKPLNLVFLAVLIAATLYRDFKRGRDDVTVVAVREGMARIS